MVRSIKYKSKKKVYSHFYKCPECRKFMLTYAKANKEYTDEQIYWCDYCAFIWLESDLTDHLEEN